MPNVPEPRKESLGFLPFVGIFGGIIVLDAFGWITALMITIPATLGAHFLFQMERKEIARRIGRYLRDAFVVFLGAAAFLIWNETRDPTVWKYGGSGAQIVIISLMYGAFFAGIPIIVEAWKDFRAEGNEPETIYNTTPSGMGARAEPSSTENDAFSFSGDRFADNAHEAPRQEQARTRSPRTARDSYSVGDVMAEAKRWASQVSDEKADSTAEKWGRMATNGKFDPFRKDVAQTAAELLRERLKGMANRPTPLLASDDEVLKITKL